MSQRKGSRHLIEGPASHWTPALRAPFRFLYAPPDRGKRGRLINAGTDIEDVVNGELLASGVSMAIDVEAALFEFRFPDRVGASRLVAKAAAAHPVDFVAEYCADGTETFGNPVSEALRGRITELVSWSWSFMTERFRRAVAVGLCRVTARAGSALAPTFTALPADVFAHFDMVDWRTGTAVSRDGERLYSIHAFPAKPVPVLSSAFPVTPQRVAVALAFAELYPDGDPGPGALTNHALVHEMQQLLKRLKAEGDIATLPSPDTILRAVGRKLRR